MFEASVWLLGHLYAHITKFRHSNILRHEAPNFLEHADGPDAILIQRTPALLWGEGY